MKNNIFLLDVGGTNTRLYFQENNKVKNLIIFQPKNFNELRKKLKKYFDIYSKRKLSLFCCFAGKVSEKERIVSVTRWKEKIEIDSFFKYLNVTTGFFLNDGEAAIIGLNEIKEEIKTYTIFGTRRGNFQSFSLFYLGTGLGTAIYHKKPMASEFSSLLMPTNRKNLFERNLNKNLLIDDILCGSGLSNIAKILYNKTLTPEEVGKEIISKKMIKAGKVFAKFAGRAAKMFLLSFPVDALFIGGKVSSCLTREYYGDFVKEFLADENNLWWLQKIAIIKVYPYLDLPLRGLQVLAEKRQKEITNE